MAPLSPLEDAAVQRLPLLPELVRRPWLADHRVRGRAVLPAVEAMQLLAMAALARGLTRDALSLQDLSFPHFLPLDGERSCLELNAELIPNPEGLTTRLVSRRRAGAAGIVRSLVHAAMRVAPPQTPAPLPSLGQPAADVFQLPAERLYAELVPLGPAFRNLQGQVRLWPAGAQATVSGGSLPAATGPLGAPFALDGAFHAACAWSQRYARCVAYPVALAARHIFAPTRSGECYRLWIEPSGRQGPSLLFNLWLFDAAGGLCEAIEALQMRDVSGGRLQPPAWIIAKA